MKTSVRRLSGKKYLHVLDHENTTTASFGFVQPIMVNERAAKDMVDIRTGQSVFLAPMSKPTFGKVVLKTYHSFVPFSDIWHPWESFLAGQTYSGSDVTYIPENVPSIIQGFFSKLLTFDSKIVVYKFSSWTITNNGLNLGKMQECTYEEAFRAVAHYRSSADTDLRLPIIFDEIKEYVHGTMEIGDVSDSLPSSDWYMPFLFEGNYYVFFGYYNTRAKNIRKVLVGCGYQLNWLTSDVSLLPLFCYFKAYFDLFNPPRDRTWKETAAFGFMERVEQNDLAGFNQWYGDQICRQRFFKFFFGLAMCFYTQNPDYVSAHIVGNANEISTQSEVNIVTTNDNGQPALENQVNVSTGMQPNLIIDGSNLLQQGLDILKQMYYRINSATAIGGRIKAFLRSEYGNTQFDEPESNFIGSQSVDCHISLVESTAATDDAYLGQYAAIGRADDGGREFHFECKTQGCVVSLMAVVPVTRYAQAVDPNLNHLQRYDYFTERFDSITLVPTPKYNIFGVQEVYAENTDFLQGFGNIPNYMEYKTKYNILNGDMSLGSTRTGYLPFTLNKLLPYLVSNYIGSSRPNQVLPQSVLENLNPDLLVASSRWRYIGKEKWLGYFDRIFIESGTASDGISIPTQSTDDQRDGYILEGNQDDPFIIYNFMDYKVHSFALPVADSWQTGAFGDNFEVEKA